ncbi:response regulator transcription factor [Cytobacillus sp. Hz8]|uniref:response regulator transcription factor n=1 Tax=Cytobacillus sp. Hz8 TaxID=3347168 RepID=UPI0035E17F4F
MISDKILIVDDDADLVEVIKQYLLIEGFKVEWASVGTKAITFIDDFQPDLIILDVMMPGFDGYDTCQAIRTKSNVPILFLSAKEEDIDKILGLRIGGDDYMTKPFSSGELIARIKAHLRRGRMMSQSLETRVRNSLLEFPGLSIDLQSCVVKVDGRPVNLPVKEFQLLKIFAENVERVYSVEQLFQLIWGEDSLGDNRTVMVHISNLRKKIEPNPAKPKYLLTVRGIDYKFNGHLTN